MRVTASDIGSERVSIKKEEALRNADCGLRSGDIFDIRVSLADEGDVMFSTKGYAAHGVEAVLVRTARADPD